MRSNRLVFLCAALAACGPSSNDATDSGTNPADARVADAPAEDAPLADDAPTAADAAIDAPAPPVDAGADAMPVDPSTQIAAVKAAIVTATTALPSMPIQGAIVTYVKPGFGGALAGTDDGPGFFLQAADAGPAVYVAIDPATFVAGGVAVGDKLDVIVSEGKWLSCAACTIDNSLHAVTAATGTRTAAGQPLPASQDLSAVALLPIGVAPWPYEVERSTVMGTLATAFAAAGGGFQSAQLTTAGVTVPSASLVLRVPAGLVTQEGLASGCTVAATGTPLWRFTDNVQVAAWQASDLMISCPPLAITATSPADAATAVDPSTGLSVTFNEPLDATTVTAQTVAGACTGSVQLSTDDFATCLPFASAAPVTSSNDMVASFTPAPALSYGIVYKLKVLAGVKSTNGNALAADAVVSFTTGLPGPSCNGSLVISEVYGGGGNSGAPFSNDFIELHNRGGTAVNVNGWSVQYAGAASATWNVTSLPNVSIPPGGYLLVQEAAGATPSNPLPTPDATGTIAMGSAAGKVALVASTTALTGACPAGNAYVDLVGYGSGVSCFEGAAAAPAPSNTTADQRAGGGCADTNVNSADFATGAPAPQNSASSAAICGCGGDTVLNETGVAAELDYCDLQFPTTLSVPTGAPTGDVFAQVFEAGVTEAAGAPAGLVAQIGYGPLDRNPETQSGWTWFPTAYNVQVGNNDEYKASFTAPAAGTYKYTARVSLDGVSWTYCDLNGAGSNAGLSFEITQLPTLTVTP
jgi:hypothetical protein